MFKFIVIIFFILITFFYLNIKNFMKPLFYVKNKLLLVIFNNLIEVVFFQFLNKQTPAQFFLY
jgi:hypothetical protein